MLLRIVSDVMTQNLRPQNRGQLAQRFQMLKVDDERPQSIVQHHTKAVEKRTEI